MGVTKIDHNVLRTASQNMTREYDTLKSVQSSLNQQMNDFLTRYKGEGANKLRQTTDTWLQAMTNFVEAVFEMATFLADVSRKHGEGDAAAAARHAI